MRRMLVALAALFAILAGYSRIQQAADGVEIVRVHVGSTPVTLFRPAAGEPAPAVVIAHGFAGSQQLMQPFALTLARNGYLAATFDFPGHGRNPLSLPASRSDPGARTAALTSALDQVMAYVRGAPGSDGRVALVGHSMASDIVVRYARAHPEVAATVGVSLFSRDPAVITTELPRNLLVIDGALEAEALREEGRRIVGLVAGGPVRENVTYGSFPDGTARRLVLADGVEHIGVLYSPESLAATLAWMDAAFGRSSRGFVERRGYGLALIYLGLVALAWPLARWLPRVAPLPLGAGCRWRQLLPVAVVPALLTPLALRMVPTDFLPLVMGGYLTLHFALYGLLTAVGIALVARIERAPARPPRISPAKLGIAIIAATAYATLAIGLPTDAFVTSLAPGSARLPLILVLMCGTLPYCLADEWLTRGPDAPRGAYAVTKICFVSSLLFAIVLDPPRLFFLAIIVPAMLALFLIYGLLSRWTYGATNVPVVAAIANSLVFAWAIAVTFPLVTR
jgi:pimeloyl-ACP methyl ester carboxylesterase